MWMGDCVIFDIIKDGIVWINVCIKCLVYIWWNFLVLDYVCDYFLFGLVYGNDMQIVDQMLGFVINFMEYVEVFKIVIYSVVDYVWNFEKYNSEQIWKDVICIILLSVVDELEFFVVYNFDLGLNGYKYCRDEFVELQLLL